MGHQSLKSNICVYKQFGRKSKRIKNQKLKFLQGIPSAGPALALRLVESFGSIKSIVNANGDELKKIKGIGTKKAASIVGFFQEGAK